MTGVIRAPKTVQWPLIVLTLLLPAAAWAGPGLTVQDGALMRDGKPYRGAGVNYFSLFSRMLKDSNDVSSLEGLKRLSKEGIPFVRFMACGFWPADYRLYMEDKEAYFRLMDRVVRCAEENRIGLIPSLFWHYSTISDLVGEPTDQLGNPSSKTIEFIGRYTRETVSRYKDSPAIWGWEFGNEYNLACDLPNAATHRPAVVPRLKTATTRSSRDELTIEHLQVALAEFGKVVRKLDPDRLIISGNSIPRASAHHNKAEKSWKRDTRDEFGVVLLRENPDPMSVVSVHTYPEKKGGYSGAADSIDGMIEAAVHFARSAGKPLFVGEFGVEIMADEARERALFEEFIAAFEKHRVPLVAVWVYDYTSQDKLCNITFENKRAHMLKATIKLNERMNKP